MKKLGSTNLKCPPVIFGGNVFGWTTNKKESFELIDQILDMGINMIDTADVYSRWAKGNKGGESEKIIGKYLKARGNRENLIIATKVGSNMKQGGPKDISQKHILKAIDESLKRLQTDYVDLYFTHWDDNETPVDETLGAYQKLIEQGKVRYIGASNLTPGRLKESLNISEKNNLPKYQVFQPEYSLAQREKFEGDIRKICEQNNLGVTTYFSLASGLLTGKYHTIDDIKGSEREKFLKTYFNERTTKILTTLKEISDHRNISQTGISLRWLIQRPGVTAPIASASKPEHLKAFREAIQITLSAEEMEMLNQASA